MADVMRPDLAPGSRIVIVRHGEAASNADDIVAGHLSCKGLTDHGRSQVAALANRLRRTGELDGAAALYSSVLRRAVETAEILAPALGGLEVHQTCDLCERHVGEADGMTWAEYEARYGEMKPPYDPARPMAPGGESWVEFLDRAEAALYEVIARHPGELVVIAGHGGIVGASLVRFLGLADHGADVRGHADNSSMTEWAWTGARWWFVRYNDAAHLDKEAWGASHGLRIPAPDWVTLEP
ncbi:MAG TPA: histidine phosphatase family protein [Acidimicrobiales bacterium]|nr:histidine phosphatase family protein [Acidimicrobiales bacterium]